MPGLAPDQPRSVLNGTAFIERGRGEPLLLIHGVGLNADAWGPQIAQLSCTHRVIAIDMPGHGASRSRGEDTLPGFVAQAGALLDGLGIAESNVVGHSMGGLVALGLALAQPGRVLRLGVLNSVFERSAAARSAVEARARDIARSGAVGDVGQPVRRWLGEGESELHHLLRRWLSAMDPAAYARAYAVFATGDRLFSGRLGELAMPALFATGGDDPNSTAAMAEAMAAAAPLGRAAILPGQRHMMNLVAPEATTLLLRGLLDRARGGGVTPGAQPRVSACDVKAPS